MKSSRFTGMGVCSSVSIGSTCEQTNFEKVDEREALRQANVRFDKYVDHLNCSNKNKVYEAQYNKKNIQNAFTLWHIKLILWRTSLAKGRYMMSFLLSNTCEYGIDWMFL